MGSFHEDYGNTTSVRISFAIFPRCQTCIFTKLLCKVAGVAESNPITDVLDRLRRGLEHSLALFNTLPMNIFHDTQPCFPLEFLRQMGLGIPCLTSEFPYCDLFG